MKIPSLFLLVALVLPMTPALVHAQGAPPCRWWSVTLTRHPRCWSPPTYANGTVAASIPDPLAQGEAISSWVTPAFPPLSPEWDPDHATCIMPVALLHPHLRSTLTGLPGF